MLKMTFSRCEMKQNLIFRLRKSFQNLTCRKSINSESNALYFFSIQNLTLWKTFKSKSDVFYYVNFKIWHVVKVFVENLLFISSFQILAELLSNFYQHQRTTCWIMTMVGGKTFFYECVACLCLTFGTIFLVIDFFVALGFLVGVMTISLALPIDF